jgi:hypothetical protein
METKIEIMDVMVPPTIRRPKIRGNQVVLSGVGYTIIYNSIYRITFCQQESKDKIIFIREGELYPWRCSGTNWMVNTAPFFLSSFQQAALLLDEIVNTNAPNQDE